MIDESSNKKTVMKLEQKIGQTIAAAILLCLASVTAASSQTAARPAAPSSRIYSLDFSDRASNWTPGMPDTKIRINKRTMELQGAKSQVGYQLISEQIEAQAGATYEVSYDIRVTSGGMSIGVLDSIADKFIDIRPIEKRQGTISFTAPSKLVQIIVNNRNSNNDQASSARITKLEMTKKR